MAAAPVLDASAFLAYLRDEPGAELVAQLIAAGAEISAVNLAEALSTAGAHGADATALAAELVERGLLGGAVSVEPFTAADAIEVARLRPPTRTAGLSLGDRACLALARRQGAVAFTADSAWAELGLDIDVRVIR
jgi:ribonuclease VapC